MQGVPEHFTDEKDYAQFRHHPMLPGIELYHAHVSRYAFEPHTHEAFGIGTIDAGAEAFRYRGAKHVASVNSLVLMNPDELHTGQSMTEDGWRYRMIYIRPETLETLSGEKGWWFTDVVRHDPGRARQLALTLSGLWQTTDPLASESLMLSLISLFRPHARIAHQAIAEPTHRFDIVKTYLRDNFARTVTLNELSSLVALSPYHFLRQFKAQFHVTPHQMLMAIRLYEAKQMLTYGMPAAQVALAVGLTDQAHLTKTFSQRYGITPIRYQKQVMPRRRLRG